MNTISLSDIPSKESILKNIIIYLLNTKFT